MKNYTKESSTNQENKKNLTASCSVNDTFSFLGRRWLMAILYEVSLGHNQFSALLKKVPGVSEHMLASRIDDLVKKDLIIKRPIENTIPVQIVYSVTKKGAELLSIAEVLNTWTRNWEG
ncbi:helix-turn-helix domain-containing protein [Chryseobacterium sp. C39-AII1]|uniref:winged helix-turn-helix transcriptional regulator n=1 Tax=Chryseobacterium sp. C39-AII1 TaxID=3080332 RepID=UPI00320B9929